MVEAELKLFKQHPIIGQICLQPVERLDPVGAIVFSHHENYDGSGFPDGLKGEQIPLGARIIRVAADYTGLIRKWPKDMAEIRQRAVKYLGHSANCQRCLQLSLKSTRCSRITRCAHDHIGSAHAGNERDRAHGKDKGVVVCEKAV